MVCNAQQIYLAQRISKIVLTSALTLIALTSTVNLIMPSITGISILIGGAAGILNFYCLSLTVKNSAAIKIDAVKSYVTIRYSMRFAATAILIYILVSRNIIEPTAFLAGLTVVIFNIVFLLLTSVKKEVV